MQHDEILHPFQDFRNILTDSFGLTFPGFLQFESGKLCLGHHVDYSSGAVSKKSLRSRVDPLADFSVDDFPKIMSALFTNPLAVRRKIFSKSHPRGIFHFSLFPRLWKHCMFRTIISKFY